MFAGPGCVDAKHGPPDALCIDQWAGMEAVDRVFWGLLAVEVAHCQMDPHVLAAKDAGGYGA